MKKAVLRRDLSAGATLSLEDVALKKTAPVEEGTPITDLDSVVGRRLARALEAGAVLRAEDLETA